MKPDLTSPSSLTAETLKSFVVFVLAHGRPDKCPTFHLLKKSGYKGRIVAVIDNEDKTRKGYEDLFGSENVCVFDKQKESVRTDNADNFSGPKGVVIYARNACFDFAKKLGYQHFIELDDDYNSFCYRMNGVGGYCKTGVPMKNLPDVLAALLRFKKATGAVTVAMAQGGDFIGGHENAYVKNGWTLRRKAMNSFILDTNSKFRFIGRINEDVNSYVLFGSRGDLIFTVPFLKLEQAQTQSNSGGMTDAYLQNGTYMKSFYSVMIAPSAVKIARIGSRETGRIHHSVKWNVACPKIVSESLRKN